MPFVAIAYPLKGLDIKNSGLKRESFLMQHYLLNSRSTVERPNSDQGIHKAFLKLCTITRANISELIPELHSLLEIIRQRSPAAKVTGRSTVKPLSQPGIQSQDDTGHALP